jgi:CPA1 family monovalent cation:H+ antiporter
MGWYTPELTTVQTRLTGRAFWEILTFLLNAVLFGLVGLQLRPIVDALSGTSGSSLVGDAAVIVTIAAALSIPLRTDAGAAFDGRDSIVFFAFAVVLGTLVIQGLTLPAVIRGLGLEADKSTAEAEEAHAQIRAAEAAIARLDELVSKSWVREGTAERLRRAYQFRIDRFRARFDADGDARSRGSPSSTRSSGASSSTPSATR